MNESVFENLFSLLTEHNFELNNYIPNDLLCIKCKRIINNACQAPCGCKLCYKCITELSIDDYQICSCNTNRSQISNLSDFQLDSSVNENISKLIVKCPEEMCVYECELADMDEHLRFCAMKKVKCPFYIIGCQQKKVTVDKINEHFRLDNYNHSRMMMDIIGHLRNEVAQLKNQQQTNTTEMDLLKKKCCTNEIEIKSMKENMEIMKDEKDCLSQQLLLLEQCFNNKITETVTTMDCKYHQTLELMRSEIREMEESKQELQQSLARTCEKNKIYQSPNDCTKMSRWVIDEVREWQHRCELMLSDYFYCDNNRYKMRLCLENHFDELFIHLRLYSEISDIELPSPFAALVTIDIVNDLCPGTRKSICKRCSIEKPEKYSYKCSEKFKFYLSDLSDDALLQDNRFVVLYNIEMQ